MPLTYLSMMGMSAYAGMACCGKPHFCVYQGAGPADSPLSPQACEARVVELNIVEKWEQRRQLEREKMAREGEVIGHGACTWQCRHPGHGASALLASRLIHDLGFVRFVRCDGPGDGLGD